MTNTEILFAILNYKEKKNAERLYHMISPYFSCRILDADSGERPDSFNGDTIYLPNIYFGGLLNKAIELAQQAGYTYLFFICSDVIIEEKQFQIQKSVLLEEDFSDVAIYCPSHATHSYTFVQWAYGQSTGKKRKVPCVEAMISMWNKDVFNRVYPCQDNKYGWGMDIAAAHYAKQMKQYIYIDDRVQIHHPMGGNGKNDLAGKCALRYIDTLAEAKQIRDYWHWIYVYRLNRSANILLLKHYKFWCLFFYKLRKVCPYFGYKF